MTHLHAVCCPLQAPRSSSSSLLEKLVRKAGRSERHAIVINKVDLVSEEQRHTISEWMSQDHPGVPVFFTSAVTKAKASGDSFGARELLDAAIARMRATTPRLFQPARGETSHRISTSPAAHEISQAAAAQVGTQAGQSLPLIMMIVGVPNVGKSSLINAFRRISNPHSARPSAGTQHRTHKRSHKPARTGALPGVTTALSGFQVSWEPTVWMLDTPGVLTPRIEGGWESALRLAAIDLMRYEHDAVEGIGAYVLFYLATNAVEELSRWPSAHELALGVCARPDTAHQRDASTPHWQADRSGPLALSDDEGTVGKSERLGLRLLEAVAADMGLQFRTGGKRQAIFLPDTTNAAGRVLGLLRRGELGHICFDTHPPVIGDQDGVADVRRPRPRASRSRK